MQGESTNWTRLIDDERGILEVGMSWDPPSLPISFAEALPHIDQDMVIVWNALLGRWDLYGKRKGSNVLWPKPIIRIETEAGNYRPPGEDTLYMLRRARYEHSADKLYYHKKLRAIREINEKIRRERLEKFTQEQTVNALKKLDYTWRNFGKTRVSLAGT